MLKMKQKFLSNEKAKNVQPLVKSAFRAAESVDVFSCTAGRSESGESGQFVFVRFVRSSQAP